MPKPRITLTPIESSIMSKLTPLELQGLVVLRDNAREFTLLSNLVNIVIEIEKNYSFLLNEDQDLPAKHAYSRGKYAFGQQLLRLIAASGGELARREQIQQDIKEKQAKGGKDE